jgi:UMF1 family MFS transporter
MIRNKGKIFIWTLFDFANTAFSVIIVTVIYSKYFTNVVSGGRRWLWGLAVSVSMIFAATLSPPMGAIADVSRNRKRFLLLFTMLCVISTALMFFIREGDVIAGLLLFILANIGFEAGLVFYDAFLPDLTEKKNFGRVSGYGFAMGYVGALVVLLIVKFLLPDATSPDYYFFIRISFLIAAVFFFVFAAPLFLFIKEPAREVLVKKDLVKQGIRKSYNTLKDIFARKKYPSIKRFLVAFFLYNDAIITIISFAAIFATNTLKMTDSEIIVLFIILQLASVVGSVIFGIISDHIGPKKTITITLFIWLGVVVGAFFVQTVMHFYLVGLLAGMSIGSSQSASRSLMALLTPKEREAEFFGFYDGLFGKSSAIAGPLFYGIISDLFSDRIAALALSIFFAGGLIIIQRVTVPLYNKNKTAVES